MAESTLLPARGRWRWDRSRKRLTYAGEPILRTYWDPRPSGIHGATDYPWSTGTYVRARRDATVIRIGNEGSDGFGRYVMLQDDRRHVWVNAHLARATVAVGRHVERGSVVAISDNTGNSRGPHTHEELWWDRDDRSTRVDTWWMTVWRVEVEVLHTSDHRNPYPTPDFSNSVERGEHGYRVMWVQWALKSSRIHGIFGAGTESMVKAFQKAHGIAQSGKVGTKTGAALAKVVR